jgi:SAM-dependent methyltransferase
MSVVRERSTSSTVCPSCGGSASLRGVIRAQTLFVGKRLDWNTDDAALYRCLSCALQFRWPQFEPDTLHSLYESGSDELWVAEAAERRDWAMARAMVENAVLPEHSVLDVGCFDGRFLQTLDASWKKRGVELNRAAAARAVSIGVEIVAGSVADLPLLRQRYGCVVSFDVIEHVSDPREFLRTLSAVTVPGGEILVGTGNTAALSWRFMGSRYWYCAPNEHISFVNPEWCARTAADLGLQLVDVIPFSHGLHSTFGRRVREVVANLVYKIAPGAIAWARRRKGITDASAVHGPPQWMSARDHILIRLRVR